jgi:hypothetical protein
MELLSNLSALLPAGQGEVLVDSGRTIQRATSESPSRPPTGPILSAPTAVTALGRPGRPLRYSPESSDVEPWSR